MRTLGPLSSSLWPSSRARPAAAVSVTGKVADNPSEPNTERRGITSEPLCDMFVTGEYRHTMK